MEIKYEDIVKANETIRTTDIKGKEYAEVNQRIKAFRMVYPTGTIETEMISNKDGIVIFKAYVFGEPIQAKNMLADGTLVVDTWEKGELLGTGTAYEKENSTFINKTSYIENCETSAVGRALGMAGFGIDTSVASAEEIQNAIVNQEETKITEKQLNYINNLINDGKIDQQEMLKFYQIKNNEELTVKQASEIIKKKGA